MLKASPLGHSGWIQADRYGERVSITPKTHDALCHLVVNSGRLVTPDEILQAVCTDTYVNPEVFRKYILEIRRVLRDKSMILNSWRPFPNGGKV